MRPTIGVIGNCQARGFAVCARDMLPEADIKVFDANHIIAGTDDQRAEYLDVLQGCQFIFSQPEHTIYGALSASSLSARGLNVTVYPYLAFPGFYPDSCYVRSRGEVVNTPLVYSSAIIAGAFCEGLPPEHAERLFNAFTYRSLGYFDQFRQSSRSLKKHCDDLGYDISSFLAARSEPFMYTINHPTIDVIGAVTQQALLKAGLSGLPTGNPVYDELSESVQWPIYPEIAENLGLVGSLDFRVSAGSTLTLSEFVNWCFAAYSEKVAGELAAPQVDRARQFIRENVKRA